MNSSLFYIFLIFFQKNYCFRFLIALSYRCRNINFQIQLNIRIDFFTFGYIYVNSDFLFFIYELNECTSNNKKTIKRGVIYV